jgi:hypothetical protein
MAPRSLRPQLNQIRAWVREGRTDAWIAHQLEVSVKDLRQFKRDHELEASESEGGASDEVDLRAADDELVAAALESESEDEDDDSDGADSDSEGSEDDPDRPKRRRGRRGGRGRRPSRAKDLEGTVDHGDEGYGLWLDPAIQDDPVYAEHWAGHRIVTVSVETDRIVIKRGGEDAESSNGDDPSSDD